MFHIDADFVYLCRLIELKPARYNTAAVLCAIYRYQVMCLIARRFLAILVRPDPYSSVVNGFQFVNNIETEFSLPHPPCQANFFANSSCINRLINYNVTLMAYCGKGANYEKDK